MADENRSATDEAGATPVTTLSETKQVPRAYLGSARRNLSEEELEELKALRIPASC
jgi:hypothetical protein